MRRRCDGRRDCPNGSDEVGCRKLLCGTSNHTTSVLAADFGSAANITTYFLTFECNCFVVNINCFSNYAFPPGNSLIFTPI